MVHESLKGRVSSNTYRTIYLPASSILLTERVVPLDPDQMSPTVVPAAAVLLSDVLGLVQQWGRGAEHWEITVYISWSLTVTCWDIRYISRTVVMSIVLWCRILVVMLVVCAVL